MGRIHASDQPWWGEDPCAWVIRQAPSPRWHNSVIRYGVCSATPGRVAVSIPSSPSASRRAIARLIEVWFRPYLRAEIGLGSARNTRDVASELVIGAAYQVP